MKHYHFLLVLLAVLFMAGCEKKETLSYLYIEPDEVAEVIRNNDAYSIIDIQVKDNFDKQHLKGAIATYAYPVKEVDQKERLKSALADIPETNKLIVVCPRGKGGATNTVDYLRELGIANERLLILTGGEEGFPVDRLSDVVNVNNGD